jgi:hypothetical protein
MQPANHERPGKQSHSTQSHEKVMLKAYSSWSDVFDLKAMCPMNASHASKPEENSSTWFIHLNTITDGAMTAHRSDLQWPIQAQGKPAITGPDQILV